MHDSFRLLASLGLDMLDTLSGKSRPRVMNTIDIIGKNPAENAGFEPFDQVRR